MGTSFGSVDAQEWKVLSDGSRYRGTVAPNGDRDGYGRWESNHGLYYEGEWKDDKPHGKGSSREADGLCYVGEWIQGIKNGKGRSTSFDEIVYDGWWEQGYWHGTGKLTSKGVVYEGEFKRGEFHGDGKLEDYMSGASYEGKWAYGKKHGLGRLVCTAKQYFGGENVTEVYEGEWEEDVRDGQGVQYFKDKSEYHGAWKKGEFHGIGKFKLSNGVELSCVFTNGSPSSEIMREQNKNIMNNQLSAVMLQNLNGIKSRIQEPSQRLPSQSQNNRNSAFFGRSRLEANRPASPDSRDAQSQRVEPTSSGIRRQRNPFLDSENEIKPIHSNLGDARPGSGLRFESISLSRTPT